MSEILAKIDIDAIMTAVTDFLTKINFQEIFDKIVAFVTGLIGQA